MLYGGVRGGGQRSGRRRWLGGLVIWVLPLVLAGCSGASSATVSLQQASRSAALTSIKRLVLHLDVGGYSTTSSRANVHGSATRGAAVELNGDPVPLHSGHWQKIVALRLGANRIVVQASMRGHAPVRRSITIVRHRSPAELEAQEIARREAEAHATEARETEARETDARARETEVASHESQAGAECTSGTYVNSAGNTVCKPEQSPTVPAGATARCQDGTYSFSESRSGTCSHHGGVAEWLSG